MILVEPYVKFLVKHDLTQEQFLLLYLIYLKRVDLIKLYKTKFPNPDGDSMISDYLIADLTKKGFLIRSDKGMKLGKIFLDIFVTPEKAVDEIFDVYPHFIRDREGVQIPLTGMDRKVFKEIYIPKIMASLDEHREVIKDIEYGVQSGSIKIGINKFLTSEWWKVLRKERIETLRVVEETNKLDEDF